MTVNYTLKEPLVRGYAPPRPFGLYGEGAAPHEVLRLLLGSVNVKDGAASRTVTLSENVFRQKARRLCEPGAISQFVFEGDLSKDDYEKFVRALSAKNADFFDRLKREITLALVAQKDRRYTECFLYIYRMLEMMAVAFPLLYATTQSDFKRSHDFLKSLMNNERDGDLKVLSSAIPIISKEAGLSHMTFDFRNVDRDIKWVANFRKQLEICQINNAAGFEFEPKVDVIFRVPFDSMPTVIVNLRNRMFHYRVSEANVELGALGGSEPICRIVCKEAMYWFALVYVEVLKAMARRQF